MTKPVTRKMAVDCLLFRMTVVAREMRLDGNLYPVANSIFLVCGVCGKPICAGEDIEFDHMHADVHGGPHQYENLRPLHAECHKKKTARDIAANAKVKRLRGETCNGPKKQIQSRGFDKTKTKGFDGRVRERT